MGSIKRVIQSIVYYKKRIALLTILFFSVFYLLIMATIATLSSEKQVENMMSSIGNSVLVEKEGNTGFERNWKASFSNEEIQILKQDDAVLAYNAFAYGAGTLNQMEPVIKDKEKYQEYEEKLHTMGIELDNATFIGVTDSQRSSLFSGAGYYMVKGTSIDASDSGKPVVLISEQLAKQNNLSVGDKISLSGGKDSYMATGELEVKVKGIFSFPEQGYHNKYTYAPVELNENHVFLPQDVLTDFEPNFYQVKQVFVYLKEASELESYIARVKDQLGERTYDEKNFVEVTYQYTMDQTWYETISLPLKEMNKAAKVMSIIIASGVYLLILLICMWVLKDKKREMGISIAVGESRSQILLQTLMELLLPIVLGLILACIAGGVSTPYVSDYIISDVSSQINDEIDAKRKLRNFEKGMGDAYFLNTDIRDGEFNFYQATNKLYFVQCKQALFTIIGWGTLVVMCSLAVQVIFILKQPPRRLLKSK